MSKTPEHKAQQFLAEAYALANHHDHEGFYNKWAKDYNQQMVDGLDYCSPTILSSLLMEQLPDLQAKILDIGCGTGLSVADLHKAGYHNLHGIDLSPAMLAEAHQTGFYQNLQIADLYQPLPFNSNLFDACISTGTFTHGHVGPEPLADIFRILKPSGILACSIHRDVWSAAGFDRTFDQLQKKQNVQTLVQQPGSLFSGAAAEGLFCLFKKAA